MFHGEQETWGVKNKLDLNTVNSCYHVIGSTQE